MSDTEYPGETHSKRLARLAIYDRVQALQPASVRKEGHAVVLAGPDAGEIGCLRDMLRFNPMHTWFIDNKTTKGLLKVRREWPDAIAMKVDVKDLLDDIPAKIALLHLDFMGAMDGVREDIVKTAASKMAMWGMVFYVFFRGRETKHYWFWDEMQKAKATTTEGKRFVGVAKLLQNALGPMFVPVFSLRYTGKSGIIRGHARTGAMGIIGFQKVPGGGVRSDYWANMLEQPSPYGGTVPTDDKLLKEYMRLEALRLRRHGHSSKEVAAILNVGSGTVAAWFALESRGAYNS